MTMSLIKSYGLMPEMKLINPRQATRDELSAFHSQDYLDFCEQTTDNDDLEKLDINAEDKFGLEYDCPLVPDLMTMIQWIAGNLSIFGHDLNLFFTSKLCNICSLSVKIKERRRFVGVLA